MVDCPVCEKIKEKKARIVYEDDELVAILPAKPAVKGHIKILPKQHATKLEELSPDLAEAIFFLSNFASSAVFDVLKAHGTNIILNESENHLAFDIIPRKENDGINFLWKSKQLAPDEMESVLSKIKDKAFVIGKKEKKALVISEEKEILKIVDKAEPIVPGNISAVDIEKHSSEPEKKPEPEEKVNYLIKHLERLP
jgi:histidine triad (HIT) family protein